MFVKKFIDKVSKKPKATSGGSSLGPEDVDPRLMFHYGFPKGSNHLAYDSVHRILAISTLDGRIKLFGRNNTQHLLESDEAVPTKFLQFLQNRGILLSVTTKNHIQVWDLSKKKLSHVHNFKREITSFTVLQESYYMYVGDQLGNISILKIQLEECDLVSMPYSIPFSESHGRRAEAAGDNAVMFMLPQPKAENERVLIIFEDGIISLWGLQENKSLYITGGTAFQAMHVETRKVLSACWVCSLGSKVAVGYSNGEILIWSVPKTMGLKDSSTGGKKQSDYFQNIPLLKLNLGYKTDKVPIVSLMWISADGKANRLYVNGSSDIGSSSSCQVILLNENTESRMIKLALPLSEACQDLKIVSSFCEQNKKTHNVLLLLLKSGELCIYDDSEIENYLKRFPSKSPADLPKQIRLNIPLGSSAITAAVFARGNHSSPCSIDRESLFQARKIHCLISGSTKDEAVVNLKQFCGFSSMNNLYITGHQDGSTNFWDASCPLLLPVLSIKYQTEKSSFKNETAVSSLYFDISFLILVSGHENGVVNIHMLQQTTKSLTENMFSLLQVKQGSNYSTHSLKLNGAVTSMTMDSDSQRLAVGTNKGSVALIETEGMTILYQKHSPSDHNPGIISMQFDIVVGISGSKKNVLVIAAEDTSVSALEVDTGLVLSTGVIRAKNLARTLFMKTLDSEITMRSQPVLLLCSEKSIRLYSLAHAIEGQKKLHVKKKFQDTCSWASVFCGPYSGHGLILIFNNGKIEIRSFPELNLMKETSIRGLMSSDLRSSSKLGGTLCSSSSDGELIVVNDDQEIFFCSVFLQNDVYRLLESISQVYEYDIALTAKKSPPSKSIDKEKKMGSSRILTKDREVAKPAVNATNLFTLFSTCNFSVKFQETSYILEDKDLRLDIDDIDLEDPIEKPKGQNFALLNKQQLGKTFSAIKGKLKTKPPIKDSDDFASPSNKNEKATGTVDDIKKRYGYASSGDQSIVNVAETKLHENMKKLQGISQRTGEMENSAKSFSSMAKELLWNAQGKRES